ncbi:MAG: hypothetical protein WDO56_12765 [Gammaproteobacteria bacterium]
MSSHPVSALHGFESESPGEVRLGDTASIRVIRRCSLRGYPLANPGLWRHFVMYCC